MTSPSVCSTVSPFRAFADLAGPLPSAIELEEFSGRLLGGVAVIVLLQDGTHLLCDLSLSPTTRTLSIRCNEKLRILNVSDIQNLLYGKKELRKVETKADIKNDLCCVALHLVGTGNCIPLHFETQHETMMFVDLVQRVKLTTGTPPDSITSGSEPVEPVETPAI